MNKKCLIIDGHSLVYRAFYATFHTIDKNDSGGKIPLNAVKLTLLILMKLLHSKEYNYCLVAFDSKEKTFRDEVFHEYKANRIKTPIEIIHQVPIITKLIRELKIKALAISGFEADDIVGSCANLMNRNDIECEIFSSDKDLLQLVNKKTKVISFKKGISETIEYNDSNFNELFYDLSPKQVVEFKAICGDGSDNFKGIVGIGKVTAIKLLKKYDTYENIFNNLHELPLSQKEKFINSKKSGDQSYFIAKIKTDILDNYNVNDFKIDYDDLKTISKIASDFNFRGFEKYKK